MTDSCLGFAEGAPKNFPRTPEKCWEFSKLSGEMYCSCLSYLEYFCEKYTLTTTFDCFHVKKLPAIHTFLNKKLVYKKLVRGRPNC